MSVGEVKALGIEKPNGPKIVRHAAISEDVSNARNFTDWVSALPTITTQAELMRDQRPILRIEPGMHTAPISRIGVDATCTLMVTGS